MNSISNIPSVRSILGALMTAGVKDVVLSPGSRNAPFLLSFSKIEAFNCISVVDERTAAFMALGMSQQTEKPVVICCTSGSAMLNYAPAIAEAFYQHIPLIMITADRPSEWIDQGEGQSIRQRNVLNGVLLDATSLGEHEASMTKEEEIRLQRVIDLCGSKSGPVQINVHLKEPLYELSDWQPQNEIVAEQDEQVIPFPELNEAWGQAERVMILVTQLPKSASVGNWLERVSADPRVTILTETTANIQKLGYISCIDRTLERFLGLDDEAEFVPEVLVTIGENIISKKIKAFLRNNKGVIRRHFHFGPVRRDTFGLLSDWIPFHGSEKLPRVEIKASQSGFGALWKNAFYKAEQRHHDFLLNAPYSDLTVFAAIMDMVPLDGDFQMGNSSVVRYVQLFNQLVGVRYFGNRGVSGIEGSTSTAVGAAMASDRPVLFVSGDHAFRYDANGLSFESLPPNLKIVVINNGGGNIFRIIDGPQNHAESDAFVEHAQEKSVQKLVEYHGVGYSAARNIDEVMDELERLWNGAYDTTHVLEIFTPRIESPQVLKAYFEFIRE